MIILILNNFNINFSKTRFYLGCYEEIQNIIRYRKTFLAIIKYFISSSLLQVVIILKFYCESTYFHIRIILMYNKKNGAAEDFQRIVTFSKIFVIKCVEW